MFTTAQNGAGCDKKCLQLVKLGTAHSLLGRVVTELAPRKDSGRQVLAGSNPTGSTRVAGEGHLGALLFWRSFPERVLEHPVRSIALHNTWNFVSASMVVSNDTGLEQISQ